VRRFSLRSLAPAIGKPPTQAACLPLKPVEIAPISDITGYRQYPKEANNSS
jgi:hypothetical protein